ncbi:hypothetical protein [Roseibium sp.]|uniref:hypothetical protein n=1 Tax=Roseibium sp. TaxID=1936156 RepID=UPI003D0DCB0C
MSLQHSNTRNRTSVPAVQAAEPAGHAFRNYLSGHNLFMMACCAAMILATGYLVAVAPAGQTLGQTLLLAAPMLGCVGMHLVMHRFMGKSCHGHGKQETKND